MSTEGVIRGALSRANVSPVSTIYMSRPVRRRQPERRERRDMGRVMVPFIPCLPFGAVLKENTETGSVAMAMLLFRV